MTLTRIEKNPSSFIIIIDYICAIITNENINININIII